MHKLKSSEHSQLSKELKHMPENDRADSMGWTRLSVFAFMTKEKDLLKLQHLDDVYDRET